MKKIYLTLKIVKNISNRQVTGISDTPTLEI